MIIRNALRLRHGRIALPKLHPFAQRQHQHRSNSSLESTPSTEASVPSFIPTTEAAPALAANKPASAVAINDPNHPVAQDYAFFQHQKSRTGNLGTSLSPHYRPSELLTNPPKPSDITLELLIASQTHIGHATSLWHPGNARYIFGVRDGVHIISPDITASHLRRACKIVSGVTERGGLVLFVGTREGQARAVVKAAQLSSGCHLFTKWIPGSITNNQQILGRCGKKVLDEHDREHPEFSDQLLKSAAIKPDLVVCLNPLENYVLLHECGLNNIPTVGIVDSDVNPTWVTYPIPANDDSLRAVQVIAGVLGRAGEEGQEKRRDAAKSGFVSFPIRHGLSEPTRGQATSQRKSRGSGGREKRQTFPTPDVATAPEFPDDHVGQSVEDFENDQKLLAEADAVLFGGESEAKSSSSQHEEDLEAVADAERSTFPTSTEEDLSSIDPSLTNPTYSIPAEDAYDETEDLAQFATSAGEASAVESEEMEDIPSPLDQVDEVVRELGEEEEQKQEKK